MTKKYLLHSYRLQATMRLKLSKDGQKLLSHIMKQTSARTGKIPSVKDSSS